jgi:DNA polymerase III, delta subunit
MHDLVSFEATQPLATMALYQAIKQQRLAHGLLLVGQPITTMLVIVQALYKAMACEQPSAVLMACQTCRSCRWMTQNAHPNFITVSPLSLFVEEDSQGGVHPLTPEQANKLVLKPANQIKVAQIRYLQEQLSHHAGQYPRMVVFCDATMQPATLNDDDTPITGKLVAPYDVTSLAAAEGQDWVPLPLSRGLFNAQSANRFLKTLEEPGPNTFFVFLAQQLDDVLPTIASRCQVIPFQPEQAIHALYPKGLATFWENWFTTPQHPALGLKHFLTYLQETGTPVELGLTQTLQWCRVTQRHTWTNRENAKQWFAFLKKVNQVKEMLSHHVSQEHALLSLFY